MLNLNQCENIQKYIDVNSNMYFQKYTIIYLMGDSNSNNIKTGLASEWMLIIINNS